MLSKDHIRFLEAQAIPRDFAESLGIRSVEDGIIFPWTSPSGEVVEQLRLDEPRGDTKYLSEPGRNVLWKVGDSVGAFQVLIVEGTKQCVAAAACRLPGVQVIGIGGCSNWTSEGIPLSDLEIVDGKDVVCILDADIATNRDVWDAAKGLGHAVSVEGATGVRYAAPPGRGTTGLDDFLGSHDAARRPGLLARLVAGATAKMPARPTARARNAMYFMGNRLLAEDLATDIFNENAMAVNAEKVICVYREGVYQRDPEALVIHVLNKLGNDFKPAHVDNVCTQLVAVLKDRGAVLPEWCEEPLLNLPNGMLDLRTLTLRRHSPEDMSWQRLPVEWDADATCPVFDQWLESRVGKGQVEDLLESTSVMLDPSRTPVKALFLYGPSRSGKSTYLRILKAVVGSANTSAVTLHQLSTNRFMAANVYGKILNSAADLSSQHVEDLSTFKMMMGEDDIQADRKYGKQFMFRNTALFAFSANEIPTVGEASTAYLERIKPFVFPHTFAGSEDYELEKSLHRELPGILRRLAVAYQGWLRRGNYRPTDKDVLQYFAVASDRVRMWVEEGYEITVSPVGTAGMKLYDAFASWSQRGGFAKMGRKTFYSRLRAMNIPEWKVDNVIHYGLVPLPSWSRNKYNNIKLFGSNLKNDQKAQGEDEPEPTFSKSDVLAFDLETGSVTDLWRSDSSYLRLCGYPDGIDTDAGTVMDTLRSGTPLAAHNGFGFDFLVLHRFAGLDIIREGDAGRLIDTKTLAFLADPPDGKLHAKAVERYYSLDSVANRLLGFGKTDSIKKLAAKHGGFDKIPLDDEEYRAYLRGDVRATQGLLQALPVSDYAGREMRLLSRLSGSITARGFRVDTDLLERRISEGERQGQELVDVLRDKYGLPTTREDGTPYAAPHRTEAGRAAISQAFADIGVDLSTTPTGRPALGKNALNQILETYGAADKVVALTETVLNLNGIRTVYGTVRDHLANGRVHPLLDARQASGRFSVTNPGLTVMGKRGGRHVERDVFLADDNELLICFDLAQVDARAVAAHAQDEAYLAMFLPGVDIHAEVAHMVWGVRDKTHREKAKAIGHGWNYGMGIKRLAASAGVTIEDAQDFDDTMRERFPDLVRWRDQIRFEAEYEGPLDNGFGRKMNPDPDRAWTQGPALIGQGCARDLMMEGILRLPLEIVPMLRAIVHDEIVLSVPTNDVDNVREEVLKSLQFEWAPTPDGQPVMILADGTAAAKSWGACYQPAV